MTILASILPSCMTLSSRLLPTGHWSLIAYNDTMEVDVVRIACPACGSRLSVMPRVKYLACKHCGSEYLVQRRGNTIGLEPFVEEQYEISQKIAEVERSQGEGCSNVFFWIFLVAVL